MTIYLRSRGSGTQRPVNIVFRDGTCGKTDCPSLDGTLSGTLAVRPAITPDTGSTFGLKGSGWIAHLGNARAVGTGQGTGFIAHGRETLVLTVRGANGSIKLSLTSPPVSGFTSP